MGRLSENSVLVIKNKSHAITAEIEVPEGGADGVIVAQGGAFGGWSLYVHEGKPAYCYNIFGLQRFKVYGGGADCARRASGSAWSSTYDGGGLGKGGGVCALRRRDQGRDGRVEMTVPMVFSADETTDVGSDSGHARLRRPRAEGHRVHRDGSTGSSSTSTRRPRTSTT